MSDLKPYPFCGNLLEIVHKNGSKYMRCISGICIFETARHGHHISDDELIKRCNRRPAEDAKDKEIENLKAALKQIAEIANRRGHLTVATWQKDAWYEMAKIAKEALANAPDTGKMEEK